MAIHGADSVTDRAPFRPPWGRCGASGGGGVAIKCAYQVTARTPSLSPEDGCGASGGKRCDKRFLIGRCAPRGVDATAGRIQVQNFGGLANHQRWGTFERIGSLGSSGGAQVGIPWGGGPATTTARQWYEIISPAGRCGSSGGERVYTRCLFGNRYRSVAHSGGRCGVTGGVIYKARNWWPLERRFGPRRGRCGAIWGDSIEDFHWGVGDTPLLGIIDVGGSRGASGEIQARNFAWGDGAPAVGKRCLSE